jgi:ABC-type transport system involved in multi-copper enzyme maturation permease subunit
MLRPLRSELYRLRRRWMTWIVLALGVGLAFAFYELIYVSLNAQLRLLQGGNAPPNAVGPGGIDEAIRQIEDTLQQVRPEHIPDFGVSLVAGLGAVMLIVFSASHMGTEFGWGTLRTSLASGLGRGQFLATKLVSAGLYALLFTVLGVASAVAASFLVSSQAGFGTSGLDLEKVLSAGWRTAYAFLPYIALASFIAVWSRSSGAGIAAGLVIYFAESIVMQLLISFNKDYATIANLGISRNVSSLSRISVTVAGSNAQNAGVPLPDQGQAALVLAVWIVIFIALSFWRLRTRDITLS